MLQQFGIIEALTTKFEDSLERVRSSNTSAPPGSIVLRTVEGYPLLEPEEQLEYQSGVGSIIYLLKHSRPDLSNSVRGLTKVMDKENYGHRKKLIRVIKYVNDTKSIV